jgi:von Willebrand factor type A domain
MIWSRGPLVLLTLAMAASGCEFSPGQTSQGGIVGEAGAGGSPSCGQTNVPIATLPPDILILQDRSLSMNQNAAGSTCNAPGCSKWSQVATAVNDVVMATQANVNWGLQFFGDGNMCGVATGAAIGVGPNNYAAIQHAFAATSPGGYTPVELAVTNGAAYLAGLTDQNPKFLLLATDGLPNCTPGAADPLADDSAGAERAVAEAFINGYSTFVVGIATSSDPTANQTLNTMAANGGYPQSEAATSYYSISDTASLEAALHQIVGLAASCTMPLNGAPITFSNVAVSVQSGAGALAVPHDTSHTNGWDYVGSPLAIEFFGTACDNLKSGAYRNVQFIYACDGTKIVIT